MANFYKLQIRNGSTGTNHVDEVLKDGRITSHIDYAKEPFEKLNIGDVILIHKGSYPFCLVEILYKIKNKNEIIGTDFGINYKVEILSYFKDLEEGLTFKKDNPKVGHNGTFSPLYNDTSTLRFVKQWFEYIKRKENMENLINLLEYKKQIILQGPPGTGKTRLAKQIANKMLRPESIEIEDIFKNIKVGQEIITVSDRASFIIKEINTNEIIYFRTRTQKTAGITIADIKRGFANKIWTNVKNGSDTYSAGISKYIYDNYTSNKFKIIQFHPSYTYEDFVRGIVAKPNPDGEGILYEAENKILGEFAKQALENYRLSESDSRDSFSVKSNLERFVSYIIDEIDQSEEGKYHLTDNVYIFLVDNKRLKYKGDNWTAHPKGLNMNFTELEKIIDANYTERSDINKDESLNSLTRQHATYFTKFIEKYNAYVAANPSIETKAEIRKNFILIIDEINRANLSSVLGELIYALEYRGKGVDSIYEIDENAKLILPPNLYIIGTMNTADRSVGHIDYAIRRRFAFVNVLPDVKPIRAAGLNKFRAVCELFIEDYDNVDWKNPKFKPSKHLSSEFKPEDIMIGHSYFITKEKDEDGRPLDEIKQIELKLKYEIVPILKEYVKDGILKQSKEIETLISNL